MKTTDAHRFALAVPLTDPPRLPVRGEKPALAFWLQPQATGERLPRATIRQLIEHYTAPGDLVLTETLEHAAEARQLNRRAQPNRGTPTAANVSRLPPWSAQLAIIKDAAGGSAVAPSLAAGGFLVLALPPGQSELGALVREMQASGFQYWQHVVVADLELVDAPTARVRPRKHVELERTHRDLLVFRQPAATATAAAAVAVVWAEAVSA